MLKHVCMVIYHLVHHKCESICKAKTSSKLLLIAQAREYLRGILYKLCSGRVVELSNNSTLSVSKPNVYHCVLVLPKLLLDRTLLLRFEWRFRCFRLIYLNLVQCIANIVGFTEIYIHTIF